MDIKVKKFRENAELPFKATRGSVGADLRVYFDKEDGEQISKVVLQPNQSIKVSTGIAVSQTPNNNLIELILMKTELPIEILGRNIFYPDDEICFYIRNISDKKIEIYNNQILGNFLTLLLNVGELNYEN